MNKLTGIISFLLVAFLIVPRLWAEEGGSTVSPTLILNGAPTIIIEAGSVYADPGYSAFESANSGDVSSRVKVEGRVDSSTLGSYTLAYHVIDSFGNSAGVKRVVSVVDTTAPAISAPKNVLVTSEGNAPVAVELGVGYAKDITDLIITNDAPEVFPVGVTTVIWTATDKSGNSRSAKQLITVVAGATVVQLE